ncbi:PDDEXK nuclease domain-containing protein [Trichlorobacter ammonificans]|uniref:Nuclease YhcG n=1 Tax=Trichlorobacter ammonificans TaxID=2916410 RepID=A0ABM9D7T1_9BACT|nr:PDDEXK nuclease domain-containing protein [Trichlorobacter ammonificans]CAH2031281.1 putative nuclease YhcG [Trichlorobacter ammonificans]
MNSKTVPRNSHAFAEVLGQIQQTRQRVFAQANTALIDLYWRIGQTISHKVAQAGWGKGVVTELARYIAHADPTLKGFSDKNLWRMKQFYETYCDDEKLSTLVRELPWTHNVTIFSRCKSPAERLFYLEQCLQEKYTSRELERQIDAASFERVSLTQPKLSAALRVLQPAAGEVFKDHYVLEFLGLPDSHSENDLQTALVRHMKAFVLELGRDFLFVAEQFRLQVGNQDFFIDLLFYHRGLSALVAFELKIGKFQPEHMGQLNFYLEALDRDVKKPHENPSIGVLLCRDKDEEVVEYALSRNLSPTLIAQYQLQLPDKKLLQARLHELLAGEWAMDDKDSSGEDGR